MINIDSKSASVLALLVFISFSTVKGQMSAHGQRNLKIETAHSDRYLISTNLTSQNSINTTIGKDNKLSRWSSRVGEICGNGIDDDGDMLVDYYDNECCGTEPSFNLLCDTTCLLENNFPYDIGVEWLSPVRTYGTSGVAIGDIDADGVVEVVGHQKDTVLVILNGETGALEREIKLPLFGAYIGSYNTIADVDLDGFGEILSINSNGYLYCFEHDGTLKYRGSQPISYNWEPREQHNFYISTADFDQNGMPEVYVGNFIFNGQTGWLISSDPVNSKGVGQVVVPDPFWQKWLTVATDILPDSYCSTCDGLELVAGNQIYAVDISTNSTAVVSEIPNHGDGFTGVVDFDLDGDLDVVVLRAEVNLCSLYVWDGQTNLSLGLTTLLDSQAVGQYQIGGMVVANMDTDPEIEVAIKYSSKLYMIDDDFSFSWIHQLTDGSAVSPLGFDFNGDDIVEVVYRDDAELSIFDGATGNVLHAMPAKSGSASEHIAIADIDGDGSAEIVLDQASTFMSVGIVSGPQWAGARPVFNQPQFHNTNVNHDLTIPRQQQQHHLVSVGNRRILNNFNVPLSIPPQLIDGKVEIIDINCVGLTTFVNLEICNEGPKTIEAGIPISIYCGNLQDPTSARITTVNMPSDVEVDSCRRLVVSFPYSCSPLFTVVFNDDGSIAPPFDAVQSFPITIDQECEYYNNVDTFNFLNEFPSIDLGNDTIICSNSSINFTLIDTLQYLWNDGNTNANRVINSAGLYWVEILNTPCGILIRDSIQIDTFSEPTINLGSDTVSCVPITLELNAGSEFVSYLWNTNETDSIIIISASGIYSVSATDICGTEITDSIEVFLSTPISIDFGPDVVICSGDTIELGMPAAQSYIWSPAVNLSCTSCDTTLLHPSQTTEYIGLSIDSNGCNQSDTIVIVVDSIVIIRDTFMLCGNDSVFIDTSWIKLPGEYLVIKPSAVLCDTSFVYNVFQLQPYIVHDTINLCQGDSVFIENTWVYNSGDYSFARPHMTTTCDSIFNYNVIESYSIELNDSVVLCLGDSVFIQNVWISSAGNYSFTKTNTGVCDSIFNYIIEETSPYITFDSVNICAGDSIFLENRWINSPGDYSFVRPQVSGACDSVLFFNVSIGAFYSYTDSIELCSGDTIYIGGRPIIGPGSIQDTLLGTTSCDTIRTTIVMEASDVLSMDTIRLCSGDSIYLDGRWIDSPEQLNLLFQTHHGCDSIVNLFIEIETVASILTTDTAIVKGADIYLIVDVDTAEVSQLIWSPADLFERNNQPKALARPSETTLFTVFIESLTNCTYTGTVLVRILDNSEFYIPTTFSPDNNAVNDIFHVFGEAGSNATYSIQIFNRWGGKVFDRRNIPVNDARFGWDGTNHGQPLNAGLFIYQISIESDFGPVQASGQIQLIR